VLSARECCDSDYPGDERVWCGAGKSGMLEGKKLGESGGWRSLGKK
jgi:hypothetical protein